MLKDFTKETFDILIQAGQSNSEGYGFGNIENPYNPDNNVYYLTPDFIIEHATERVTGNQIQSNFGLSFAQEYIDAGMLEENRKILILRAAVGGTSFTDHRWGMQDDLYLRMIEMIKTALELNPANRLVALLWHQGETDAQKRATYDMHYNNLKNLVCSVREIFDAKKLPFIAGDFVHHWKNNNLDLAVPVVDAIHAVCKECQPSAFVESDGLLSNLEELGYNPLGWTDTIHFSRKAIYELGKRYFNAFVEISK